MDIVIICAFVVFRHLKSMINEEYINEDSLDDNSLLMQYFRKQDADNNGLLDGLELLKTLAKMDCT